MAYLLLRYVALKICIHILKNNSEHLFKNSVSDWLTFNTNQWDLYFYLSVNKKSVSDLPPSLISWLETRAKNSNISVILGENDTQEINLTEELGRLKPDLVLSTTSSYSPKTFNYDADFVETWSKTVRQKTSTNFFTEKLCKEKDHLLFGQYLPKKHGDSLALEKENFKPANFGVEPLRVDDRYSHLVITTKS